MNVILHQMYYVCVLLCIAFGSHELKGHSQLDTERVVRDRRSASKIIHVERIIGCVKTFKIE